MTTESRNLDITEEELHSQNVLKARINQRLDKEKAFNEAHPGLEQKQENYDCSMGMSKILESISVAASFKDDRRQTFDVFILNGLTIARNCYDKHKSHTDMLKSMKKDINLFMLYVQKYFLEQASLLEKPYVIIYLPQYKFTKDWIRPMTEERAAIYQLAETYFKKACTTNVQELTIAGGKVYLMKVGTNTFPHRELDHFIKSIGDKSVIKLTQRRYLLVSHVPLDFHLQNYLSNKLYILESYTGKIKPVADLGEKVFKLDYVPFNQYTHLLFGDHFLLKPMVYRKEKQQVLDIAKKNVWTKKPLSLILSDIRKTHVVPIDILTSVKF